MNLTPDHLGEEGDSIISGWKCVGKAEVHLKYSDTYPAEERGQEFGCDAWRTPTAFTAIFDDEVGGPGSIPSVRIDHDGP
jgi:hypothetical protein